MDPILSLIVIAAVPFCVSFVLFMFYSSKEEDRFSYNAKQLTIGIIFGIIAICGTEFGVSLNGAVMNARDAAPLCAALIFGAPAGIIAGLIGGIERWFAVYWGAGYYTRLACSISTILSGIIGALCRKRLYDDHMPEWLHALAIGVVCEVIHMLMIFVTNIDDLKTAFSYVEACALPMIAVNAIAVAFTVYIIQTTDEDIKQQRQRHMKSISHQLQKILVLVMTLGFLCTALFGYFIQSRLSQKEIKDLLFLNIQDVVSDLRRQCDAALLDINQLVVNEYEEFPGINLSEMKERFNVTEIDVVDENGIIIASSEEENIGFDMSSGRQSAEFLCLLDGETEYVQSLQAQAKDSSIYRKYSGIASGNGFIQVAYDKEQFISDMNNRLASIVNFRHIGETGNMLVIDPEGKIISDSINDNNEIHYDVKLDPNGTQENTVYIATINNQKYYYMYTLEEGYKIYGVVPVEEAEFSKKLTSYFDQFMEIVIFGALFAAIYYVTKKLIVDNIRKVNRSLNDITEGKLDTVVDIRTNREFDSLSDGINTMVDSLKQLIAEANSRIDNELRYAKEIQTSTLPSTFPAYPDHDEFDIYALMDPAKEVGGDFYDFYLLKDKILVFLVADVAGKGIPASLFMMRAKTILKTYAENNVTVADIFTNANFQLCEGNDAGMFVTAWMGLLDLETGELYYANAGHNRPLLRRKDGSFEYLQGPAGFVLAGMEGIVYKEQKLVLEPGDELFLYTDGVVEATNTEKELYGDQRLQDCLNGNIGNDAMTICKNIKEDVDAFYEGAEQFDDITELSMQFKKYRNQ
ncbi:MAG: SpoIIE family protein phosphatase [Erysipelotrichaceae bacterium]|nr:SpoIIE family protein phosphatase [Erysipelotrichaceae bacterium]